MKSEPDPESFSPYFSFSPKVSLLFTVLFTLCFFHISPAQVDSSFSTVTTYSVSSYSSKVEILYQKMVEKTDCPTLLTYAEFYALFSYYDKPKTDTVYIHKTDTIKEYINTTPTQDDAKLAKKILEKIIKDKDLTALIKEVVSDMTAKEVAEFRKDLTAAIQEMNQKLKKEQNLLIVLELGAKRERYQKARANRRKARKEKRERYAALTKEEKIKLTKAKIALAAEETAVTLRDAALGSAAAVAATGVAAAAVATVVTLIVVKGVIAIGKGLIDSAVAIWNWIESHFFIRIDLTCAEQRRIKKNKRYFAVINKPHKTLFYKGNCPQW